MMRSVKILNSPQPWLALGLTAIAALTPAQTVPAPEDADGMNAFGKMIPLGYANQDVTVPSFSAGRPSSLLTAATLTRLDDERLSAQTVVVEIYGEEPAETLRVDLKSAVYHMGNQTLRSGERSRVTRSDFQMEGDSMVFDTVHSIGSMRGRVRTLIFDTSMGSASSEAAPASN